LHSDLLDSSFELCSSSCARQIIMDTIEVFQLLARRQPS
jgi:hypothetical protein